MTDRTFTLEEVEILIKEARKEGSKEVIQALIDTWCESEEEYPVTLIMLQTFLEEQSDGTIERAKGFIEGQDD